MGRKISFIEKGPGKKSRKQKDPVFSKELTDVAEPKKLSRKQKARAKKREQLKVQKTEIQVEREITKAKALKQIDALNEQKKDSTSIKLNLKKSKKKYTKVTEKSKPLAMQTLASSLGNGTKREHCNMFESDSGSDLDYSSNKIDTNNFLSTDESSDNETSNEEDMMLPIERAGEKLKRKKKKNERLAKEEMLDIASNNERFEFPSEPLAPTNIDIVHLRIKDIIGVLADFSSNRDGSHCRADYIDLLCKDLCVYYSYNDFFMRLLIKLFEPSQLLEFLEASEVQRPLTIRTNSLKIRRRDLAQAMINRGVNLDPLGKWTKEGLVVYSSQVPLGATPEYLAGYYMIQGASSMLPVVALAPEENERILDLCAAPGGKSSHIAALMKNTGVLFANDINKDRLLAVVGNFHRLGIYNTVVTNIDGVKYNQVMTGFDRVLLDAPCTGSGVISKDPSVKTTKTDVDIQRCYNLQRKLLLTAIDCLSANSNTGGFLVYSTCSILPQENEWVIDYALRKRNVRLVPTGIDIGTEGFVNFAGQKYHPTMKLTRRFYPHTYNMDGFFVAKLQKFSDVIPVGNLEIADEEIVSEEETLESFTKKIDKKDWFYRDIIEKQKQNRKDSNHVVKIFETPVKRQLTKQTPILAKSIESTDISSINVHEKSRKKRRKITKNQT